MGDIIFDKKIIDNIKHKPSFLSAMKYRLFGTTKIFVDPATKEGDVGCRITAKHYKGKIFITKFENLNNK